MAKLQLHIEPRNAGDGGTLFAEPLDIATALMIANINLHRGAAEIWGRAYPAVPHGKTRRRSGELLGNQSPCTASPTPPAYRRSGNNRP